MNSERDRIAGIWASAKPADDLKPIPRGEYRCRIIDGALFNAKGGTPGYKLTLEVREGEYAGRRLWWDCWLSEAAISLAKRDLGKLGVSSLDQLERPLPEGIVVVAKVALRRGDNGEEFNRITRFEVAGVEPPAPEPYAPKTTGEAEPDRAEDDLDEGDFNWRTGGIQKRCHAALRVDWFLVDVCVLPSSCSSSAFNSARHSGGVQRQALRRSLAIASRVCLTISSHRPDTTAARS